MEGTTQEEKQVDRTEQVRQPRYVTHLKSNLKWPMNLILGRKVLLVGDNGAGKSSVVDAYSLVTTGEARSEGLGKGREVASAGSCDGKKVTIEATLSDGTSVSWPDGAKVVGSAMYAQAWKSLYGDAKALQSVVIQLGTPVGTALSLSTLLDRFVPSAFRERADEVVGKVATSVMESSEEKPGLSTLLDSVLDDIAHEARVLGKAATVVEETRVEPLSDDERSELEGLEAMLRAAPDFDVKGRIAQAATQGITLRQKLAEDTGAHERAQKAFMEERDRVDADSLERQGHMMHSVRSALGTVIEYLAGVPGDKQIKCPCCASATSVESLRTRSHELGGTLTKITSQGDILRTLKQRVTDACAVLERTQFDLDAVTRKVKLLLPYREVETSPSDLRARLESLRHRAMAPTANAAIQRSANQVETDRQVLQALQQSFQRIRAEVAQSVLTLATTRINYLLPPRVRVRIESTGSLGQGCALKISVDGRKETSFRLLGGAERAMVALALSSAMSGGRSPERSGIETVILDEVWLKRKSVTAAIALADQALATENGPDQVILSVVEYEGTVPEDWTVINLDKEEKREGEGDGKAAPTDADPGNPAPAVATSALPDGIERIGTVFRAGHGDVPVYWMGTVGRFTDATKRKLLKVPERVNGMLGVCLSGKEGKTMNVCTVLDGGVYLASMDRELRGAIEALVQRRSASEQVVAQKPDAAPDAQERQVSLLGE